MARAAIIVSTVVLLGLLAALLWLGGPDTRPRPVTVPTTQAAAAPFVIALVPEYDVFALRRNYRGLADYLSPRVGRQVEIVTLSDYEAVLTEFSGKRIEAAVVGSLVAVLAMDRCGARPLVRPQTRGTANYCGVLFVRDGSPIRSLSDLGSGKLAMVKTTTAGSLFPLAELHRLGSQPTQLDDPRLMWMGTFDDVITAVMTGAADVGGVKDLRLDAFTRGHPEARIRVLARGPAVPNNTMLVAPDVAEELATTLKATLLGMGTDPHAKTALSSLGIDGFIPTSPREFGPVFDLIEAAGEGWEMVGVSGPPPRRPAGKGD
ncbi:MAG: phosphate/phosphite/phosphonate ABC transporter substrate-binding protein [Tepidisphaeraceae bacterium]|jgi:phosphate/phosphite/phosphonate ABC transporter binding protein